MKMTLAAMLMLASFGAAAHHTTPPPTTPPTQTQGQHQDQGQHQGQSSVNDNDNRNTNTNIAAGGTGGNASAMGGDANASGGDASNSNNVTIDGGTYKQAHQVASAIAPNPYPTAPCIVTGTGAVQTGLFGIGGSRSKEDQNCTRRENARMLNALGERDGAVALMCQDPAIYRAMQARCEDAMHPHPAAVVVAPTIEQQFDALDHALQQTFPNPPAKPAVVHHKHRRVRRGCK